MKEFHGQTPHLLCRKLQWWKEFSNIDPSLSWLLVIFPGVALNLSNRLDFAKTEQLNELFNPEMFLERWPKLWWIVFSAQSLDKTKYRHWYFRCP